MRVFIFLLLFWLPAHAGWWPGQKAPRSIVIAAIKHSSDIREMNLAQSVAGLAAQALNEGTGDEGVWIETSNPGYSVYFHSLVARLKAKVPGTFTTWQLVERYKARGIIKGYILYDFSRNDNSINLATIYAALKKGVLIDITQEAMASSKGLKKLYDATKADVKEASLLALLPELNPHALVIANPAYSNNRDYAIAQKTMVYYGVDTIFQSIIRWVKPLSPVIGWNKGEEFKHVAPCTRWGLINTASDWCMNLALLSISPVNKLPQVRSIDPRNINWQEQLNYHAFVMSDGDNMQWTFGNFLHNKDYWSNPYNEDIPMSFTTCVLNLAQAGSDVYTCLANSQPKHNSIVEYGAGYYYPDLFARSRPEPAKLLREYAGMINTQMKRTGAKVFGFICKDVSGEQALEAYRIYAEEIEDLTGMIAVQYSPYNGGYGKVFWVKNKKGTEIPVVTCKYQLWANLSKQGSGDPVQLAGWINNDNASSSSGSKQLNWTIVHAWSHFSDSATHHSIVTKDKSITTAQRGVTPVKWTKDLLDKGTKVVSIEELLWRIRMQHNPVETHKVAGIHQ
ncbi:hypothetical protein AB6805_19515 [Chitinophaga sp. RCC_12]|uniref:hypothetical protein n=1 Tax=Chitinophaga sp. RCC_12 TaxID=3239226 RepID=UPI0035232216